MIDASIPLRVNAPDIDFAKWRSQRADAANTESVAGLNAIKLSEETDKAGALQAYRAAERAGDKNAVNKLKGYPDLMLNVVEAHRKLADNPGKQRALEEKAYWFGDSARYVSMFPEGSPERVAAWNEKLAEGRRKGYVDERMEKQWKDNPSPLVIDQALALGETAKQFVSRTVGAKENTTYERLPIRDKIAIDEQARKEAEAGVSEYETVKPEDMAKRIADAKVRIIERYYPSKKGAPAAEASATATPPPAKGGPPAADRRPSYESYTGGGPGTASDRGPITATAGEGGRNRSVPPPDMTGNPVFDANHPGGGGVPPAAAASAPKAKGAPATHAAAPTPKTKEEFNKLPMNSAYVAIGKDGAPVYKFKTKNIP